MTPNTEFDEDGNIKGAAAFENVDLFGLDNERESEQKDPEVIVQVKYREKTAAITASRSTKGYTVVLAGFVVTLCVILLALVVYTKIRSEAASSIVKKAAPEAVACQPEFDEMDLHVQYDPKRELEAGNFGGRTFALHKAKTVEVADDLEKPKLQAAVSRFVRVKERACEQTNYHRESDSTPGSVNVSSSQHELFHGRDSAAKPLKEAQNTDRGTDSVEKPARKKNPTAKKWAKASAKTAEF